MRDTSRAIALIGFYKQGNLGLGYLTSTLRQAGYRVVVIDFEDEPRSILADLKAADPIVVGFSLIFQLYIDRFATLIGFLRANGVAAHFTMGGHFPSLSFQKTLEYLPGLDRVVRFEGEQTLLELADVVGCGGDWQAVNGIAFRADSGVVATPMRALVPDLDELPFPERTFDTRGILGRRSVQIIASRGCARTCSFCSIHTFYRTAPGKVVRTRKPREVVREMRLLHDQYGISIFQFQDDDFPLFGPVWRRWTNEFIDELHRSGLPDRAIWKINCRADAVDPELFGRMREAGLYFVYMGLESGTAEGLETLNKRLTVEQNLRAVAVLKQLDLAFEFGFMLFDPSTSFESIAGNLDFLRAVVGDGSDALAFCRMIPYDGTPIKDELERAGRLSGTLVQPDYSFLDPRIDDFYRAVRDLVQVTGWVHDLHGVSRILNSLKTEAVVAERLFPQPLVGLTSYRRELAEITRESNDTLIAVIADMSSAILANLEPAWTGSELRRRGECLKERALDARDAFVYANQPQLLAALRGSEESIQRSSGAQALLVSV
jgi:anaerobic magnesium-protoporphyrin IX monomethyl ester cyclase